MIKPLFEFSVVRSGLVCIACSGFVDGKFYLYKQIEGDYVPYAEDGKVLYIGDKNTCVTISNSGKYAVGDVNGLCQGSPLPYITYDEAYEHSFLNASPVCLWNGDVMSPKVGGFCVAQFNTDTKALDVIRFFQNGSVAPSEYRLVSC